MDLQSMSDEVIEIRERLVKIEVTLENLQRSIDKGNSASGNGAVVIPVTVAIAVVEVIKVILERLV